MAKRKQRKRSSHPGVKIKKRILPSGAVRYRAHWVDPCTERETTITLQQTTHEARTQWAKAKSKQLIKLRMDLEAGIAPPVAGPLVADAVDAYLADARLRLSPRTLRTYRSTIQRFTQWAERRRIARTTDLTRGHLSELRAHLVKAPVNERHGGVAGVKRHRGVSTARERGLRSPVSVNGDLRAIKTLLTTWRRGELLRGLHSDDIADRLKPLRVDRDAPVFFREPQLRELIRAALRHDSACFVETRDEHQGARPKGTTPRHPEIAPLLVFLMLTGCRLGEALSLRWEQVDLAADNRAGVIQLYAGDTKTRQARTIRLRVSPALRRLLGAMKLQASAPHVFGDNAALTHDIATAARRRMMRVYGAPTFDWKTLRSTCGTYLTNAPGIFGDASVFLSAKQLGHSVAVAEKHYLGVHPGIDRDADTLEAAMSIVDVVPLAIEAVSVRGAGTQLARSGAPRSA